MGWIPLATFYSAGIADAGITSAAAKEQAAASYFSEFGSDVFFGEC
jgi:hypothetical protein